MTKVGRLMNGISERIHEGVDLGEIFRREDEVQDFSGRKVNFLSP